MTVITQRPVEVKTPRFNYFGFRFPSINIISTQIFTTCAESFSMGGDDLSLKQHEKIQVISGELNRSRNYETHSL